MYSINYNVRNDLVKFNRKTLTMFDFYLICNRIREKTSRENYEPSMSMVSFMKSISEAIVITSAKIHHSVVTINSVIEVKNLTTGIIDTYRIHLENKGNDSSCLLIFDTLGMALIGLKTGDIVQINHGGIITEYQILNVVYQPEHNRDFYTKTKSNHLPSKPLKAGFSLVETIVAIAILSLGILSIVQVFPYGVKVSQRAEDVTQASLLAQSMFEGLKMDPVHFPIIPHMTDVIIPIPGNGYDDDTHNQMFDRAVRTGRKIPEDLNNNGKPDVDYDGMPEADGIRNSRFQPNGLDDDGDGVVDDDGDSGSANSRSVPRAFSLMAADGDYHYDPEPNIDEEYADGIDNDGDGLIDEDTRLPSLRHMGGALMLPLLAGDGIDNDGDGRIDEEIWDGKDNDGDGLIDEDTQLAAFPFMPAKFPKPYDRYGWQIRVGRISNSGNLGYQDLNNDGTISLGDGIDNDGDGLIDEELPDGLDNDYPVQPRRGVSWTNAYNQRPSMDGLVDEDTIYAPLPNWRRVEIKITWGGDGIDNDGDLQRVAVRSTNSSMISYGHIEWGIDEEKLDGYDTDFDGDIDEDFYTEEFILTGFINLKDPSQSFRLSGGNLRGIMAR